MCQFYLFNLFKAEGKHDYDVRWSPIGCSGRSKLHAFISCFKKT